MKTNQSINKAKQLATYFVSAIMLFSFSSCAKKIAFQQSTIVPAARGDIKMTTDKNKNYVIKLSLSYLAEPSRLTPPMNMYVVWLVTENDSNQNIGQIKPSNNLKISFETVSSFKPKKIFITAEQDANTRFPSSMIVMESNSF